MSEPYYASNLKASPRSQRMPDELLFEFVRASVGALFSYELRFNGESYGWEALFLERGELFASHGGFVMRALAVEWA